MTKNGTSMNLTKLVYIGRQQLPAGMAIDNRMWNVIATSDTKLTEYIGSTRMYDGLVDLGIIRGTK